MYLKEKSLSLIVPCFNEEENVVLFFETVKSVFRDTNFKFEVIFVDDGSKDKTFERLEELQIKNINDITLLRFSRNFGKESAIFAGLSRSTGEYVSIIDADLQQRPETLLEMLSFLESNFEYDSVAAYQNRRNEGRVLSFLKGAFYQIINKVSEVDFFSGASDFRVMRRPMVEAILKMSEYHRFSKGIFSWVGFKTYYMEYVVDKRNSGESKWSIKGLFKYAFEGIIAFTTFPLKIAIYLGGIFSLFSLIYMVLVITQKIFWGINVPGFATIIVLILFLGGIQLFILGIIGEYLARIYIQGKQRPIYILKSEHIRKDTYLPIKKNNLHYEEEKASV